MESLEVVSVRLVKDAPILSEHKIRSPEDAVAVVGEMLSEMDREVVCVINLKTDGTPINCHFASVGGLNANIICPRELFKSSILSNAASMILVHNHPSGNLWPSKDDIAMTEKMIRLTHLMGIPLLDHVIVGRDQKEYFSFKEKGMADYIQEPCCTDYHELQFDQPKAKHKRTR
jgi:DNA repair protein RadC